MYARVRTVYWIFIFVGLAVMVRLAWVMLPITETAENADRLEDRIFQSDTVISRRGMNLQDPKTAKAVVED